MSKSSSANPAPAGMNDVEKADEHKDQQPQTASAAAAAVVPSADDARAARLARRSQLRDDAERDAADQERRRLESLETKAASREACRVSTLAPQLQRSYGPAQRLFPDGIALCLGFLSLSDFNSAAQTCKHFRSSAVKVKSLGYVELRNVAGTRDDPLRALAASPFRHLVKSIYDSSDSDTLICMNDGRYRRESGWDREYFAFLLELDGLTELNIRIDLTYFEDDATPIKYPPQLQHLVLDLGCDELGWENIWSGQEEFDAAPLLRGLAACPSLTILNLRIVPRNPVEIATALLDLKQIKHFTFRSWYPFRFTRKLFRAIRGMALETLSLACYFEHDHFEWDATDMQLLQAKPHRLARLQKLVLVPFCWRDPAMSLSSLRSLTSLEPELVTLSVLPHLSDHPKLRTLRLTFESDLEFNIEEEEGIPPTLDAQLYVRATAILPHLKPLAALTNLHVEHVTFTTADFASLCQTLPLLEVLTLSDDALVSLGGLVSLSRLRALTLTLAMHAEVANVAEHVGQCKSLEKLKLYNIAPAQSDEARLSLKPPSALLPRLQSFRYSSRDGGDDQSDTPSSPESD